MKKIFLSVLTGILLFANFAFAQRPPFPENRRDKHSLWINSVDTNGNKSIEREEYRAAANEFFAFLDKNKNGFLEIGELPPPKPPGPNQENRRQPKHAPVFLFLNRGEFNLSKEQFDEKANLRFIEFDVNGNGAIDDSEIREIRPPENPPFPNSAMAQFIGEEMRFGNKAIVKNAPFSAETIRTENKRLFDGTILKNESKGLIYRDGEGRMRQEQPLERIGGFPVFNQNNQPRRLVTIIDVVANENFSLDDEYKIAHRIPTLNAPPLTPAKESNEAKTEALGKKMIEGVNAEGTKTTVEIPAGQIGNDKPIYVVTEKWFSPQLQMIVYSKHSDPFIGEVIFKLVNIKLAEPAPELFKIPNDYQIVTPENNRRTVNEKIRQNQKPNKP